MKVDRPLYERGKIVVLPHAVWKARERLAVCRGRNDNDVRDEIVRRVAEAIDRGQVHDTRPRQFRVSGERAPRIYTWQRIVVSDDAAWLVDVSQAPILKVVTTFVRLR